MENTRTGSDAAPSISDVIEESRKIIAESDDEDLKKQALETIDAARTFRDLLGNWLLSVAKNMAKTKITHFTKENKWLSNFQLVDVEYEGDIYRSTEHAFQAAKTFNREERLKIKNAEKCSEARRLGQTVTLRSDWENIKDTVMLNLLRQKYKNKELKEKLLATEDAYLEEGNTWGDTYWGTCDGIGKNIMGLLTMRVREEIKD